ncbi:hypothetical protein [Arthrobacter sp. UYCu712]|uniref:hypothetical protein n=1 Tax=Arthrobacter sp. UYCu712 TaxID=3156340 RepID=UPI003398BBC5
MSGGGDLIIRAEQTPQGEYTGVMLGGKPYILIQFETEGDSVVANVDTGGGVSLITAGDFLEQLAESMALPEYTEAVQTAAAAAAAAAASQETSHD